MKKLLMLTIVFGMIINSLVAQTTPSENQVKADRQMKKVYKEEKKEAKGEKKMDKKALRKLEGKEVSMRAKQSFQSDFGNIPATTWKRSGNYDEATFMKDGTKTTAYYDADASLVGTVAWKTYADIPQRAQKYIDKKYAGYAKEEVLMFDDNEANDTDMVLYGHQFDDADNYFVEISNAGKKKVLQVTLAGDVMDFTSM
jgi:hypothetical protein